MDLNFNNYNQVNDTPTNRKCLTQIMKAAYAKMDNISSCELLEQKLSTYSTIRKDSLTILKHNLESNQKICKRLANTHKFESGLDKIALSILKPLSCSNSNKCVISESLHQGEFTEFSEAFQDITASKSTKFNESRVPSHVQNTSVENRNMPVESNNSYHFKTAREELQIQNIKKNDNQNASTNQKRKLGTRRHINSRFVSPLLANNEGSKDDMDTDLSQEIDVRLKHFEPKIIELIKSEIMDCGPNLNWDDIAGLAFAKTAIQEAVVWPMLRPDIFTGLRRPPKAVLLFGPPGTGKTLIGKCVASQSKSTFFSISASSLTSKWVGEGEKMVRALFAVARVHQPSVIFIDEIDSLLSQRTDTEHESSRRMKTEFLIQLDGATTDSEEKILVIGATNRPQELDEAARRRFVKRLYIPLPEFEARRQLVQNLISNERHELTQEDFLEIAKSSNGYSGADIRNLCSEASLGPIRSINMSLIEHISSDDVRSLQKVDFDNAFSRVRSSVSLKDLETLVTWDKTYGSGCTF